MGCGNCGTGGCSTGCGGNGSCGSANAGTASCPSMQAHDWLNVIDIDTNIDTFSIVEITFKAGRKGIYQNANNLDLAVGDQVIVEADRGIDFGVINLTGALMKLRLQAQKIDATSDFQKVLRHANLEDLEKAEQQQEREANTFAIVRDSVEKHQLDMRVVDIEWQFDGNKVTAFFTAERRIDFRKLVRDLASRLKTRIELRQIGARDATARIGGIGVCGRELCCSTWLQEFQTVTTQAAKVQNLPLNPVRLSGLCGRLKCCLNYELDQYMEALEDFPDIGMHIKTDVGQGRIVSLDIFRDLIGVEYSTGYQEEIPLATAKSLLKLDNPQARKKNRHRIFERSKKPYNEEDEEVLRDLD